MTVTALTQEHLLDGARYHANAALTAYTAGDERSILMNAAISAEQVSKAFLFTKHPTLLAETNNGSFDSLRQLAGFTTKDDKPLRTVCAKGALLRVRDFMTVKAPKEALDQLVAVRDDVLHAGLLNSKSTRELLTTFVRYANEVYDALDVEMGDRWGHHLDLVSSLITQSLTEVEHEVTRKITAAKRRYDQLMEQIPPDERSTVRVARLIQAGQSGLTARSFRSAICPACGNVNAFEAGDAKLRDAEIQKLLNHAVENKLPFPQLFEPHEFMCGICELTLNSVDELNAAGMDRMRQQLSLAWMEVETSLNVSEELIAPADAPDPI